MTGGHKIPNRCRSVHRRHRTGKMETQSGTHTPNKVLNSKHARPDSGSQEGPGRGAPYSV